MKFAMSESIYVTAREAAAELNISRATLYAYVSRGLVESQAQPGQRGRLYALRDIRALRRGRGDHGSDGKADNPGKYNALNFGAPVMESRLTAIWRDRLYYRGRDAVALSRTASFETVANLLWDISSFDPFDVENLTRAPHVRGAPGITNAILRLTLAASRDPRAHGQRKETIARTGAAIVGFIASSFGGQDTGPIAERLAIGWRRPDAAPVIRAALVLTADHELNASAFVVRCVASTGATPYSAVIAGLAALQGPRHGGQSLQVAAFWQEAERAASPEQAVAARLERGDPLPGFGHSLYGAGDVRAEALLQATERGGGDAERIQFARRIIQATVEMTGEHANIDFALVALARAFDLPAIAPLALFATGRSAGWIAHAQEQYTDGRLIRPRARYIGEEPRTAHDNRRD